MLSFPRINHIDDILPYIKGNDNFYVKEKSDYIVIDYIFNTPDMFNNPYEKECRGLLFFKNGNIMARRLHKFFNLNERSESSVINIDLNSGNWKALEKLDGSMITPIFTGGRLTWGSKAGETFLTPQIEEFVKDKDNYKSFANNYFYSYTPIFEWCSNKNRIVIDYPEDRLVLTAMRNIVTGEYFQYESLLSLGKLFKIEVVKQYPITESLDNLVSSVRSLEDREGVVLRNNEGHMVKIKADQYCMFHSAIETVNFEKDVVNLIINHKVDDVKSLLMEAQKTRIVAFEKFFWSNINYTVDEIFDIISKNNHNTTTRKEFAVNSIFALKPNYSGFIFNYFDKDDYTFIDIRNQVIEKIKNSTTSQSSLDKVRNLWDGGGALKW